jgi:hypothetical protein
VLSFTGAGAANNVQERARRRLRRQPFCGFKFVTILEKKKKKNGEEEEEEDVDEER